MGPQVTGRTLQGLCILKDLQVLLRTSVSHSNLFFLNAGKYCLKCPSTASSVCVYLNRPYIHNRSSGVNAYVGSRGSCTHFTAKWLELCGAPSYFRT